ncbi:alpha/beta hydrolase [Kitasatospora sp. NPDC094015]|uniref:alpha/beta hydrolase n=1 Tax=Kitasatospora sp. NPDC094015 TaxID=3155205 RepID=UPI00331786D6
MDPVTDPATGTSAPTEPRRGRRGAAGRLIRAASAVLATLLAFLTGAIVLGAYIPAIPKAGVIGPVLAGQYPFLVALLGLVGVLLSLPAARGGPVRWGRTVALVTATSTVAALTIAGVQVRAATRAGADISWSEVFTELSYPDDEPDDRQTYAAPGGRPLAVDAYLPDAYLPDAAADRTAPAVVLAHAGGFHTFDRSDLRGTARWLAEHGVAAFAVDYRLATPTAPTWDQAPQDLVCALGWLRGNADRYHVDPGRIAIGGMSAGGTLALDAAYRLANGTITSSCGTTPAPPAAAVGFYPGPDVTEMWQRDVAGTREAATLFTGGSPEQYPDRYREVSPSAAVRPGLMRTLLVVGDRDRSTPPAGVRRFADSLRAERVDVRLEVLPFADHAFDDAYGSITSATGRRILLDFLTAS